ncbi:MAG: hypothetical protein WAW02_12570 [Sideroxyarcus sp.]
MKISEAAEKVLSLQHQNHSKIIFDLGVSYQYHHAPKGVAYSADYPNLGLRMWKSISYELYKRLCKNGRPQEWLSGIAEGDTRELAVALLTILVADIEVTLSVAVPAAALIIKDRLHKFCAATPPKRSIKAKTMLAKLASSRIKRTKSKKK